MQTTVMADTAPITRIKRPLWRRIARVAGIVLGSVVTLAVIALAFLHTSWGKSFVRARIEHKLAGMVNGKVELASLDYSFMFGEIRLGGIAIDDASGRRAIGIEGITVDLDRGSLLRADPLIHDLEIRGLDVAVVKTADGGSNLKTLFKPSHQKPLSHIRIAQIGVTGAVSITNADGTKLAVQDLSVAGSLDARPASQQIELALAHVGARLETGKKRIPIAVDALSLSRKHDSVDLEIAKVAAGVVQIAGLAAHVKIADGHLAGAQSISIGKVRVDSKALADLLGHELLVDDVAIDASITGPASALAIAGSVQTHGAKLALAGTVDAAAARPTYQLSLVGTGLCSEIVAAKVPHVDTELRVDLHGAGRVPGDIDAELALAISQTKLEGVPVEGVDAKLVAHQGEYRLEKFAARGLGFTVAASGDIAADKAMHGRLTVDGDPAHAIKVLAAAGIAVPRKVPVLRQLHVAVNAAGNLDGKLAVEIEPTRIPLAGGEVALAGTAQLDHRVLAEAASTIELHKLDLASLARLAGKEPKLQGSLSGKLELARTASDQHAKFDYTVALPTASILARGSADASSATARADVVRNSDHAKLATLTAQLPLDKQGLRPQGTWHVGLDLARRPIAELAALAPKHIKAPGGAIELHVDIGGSPAQPSGTFTLAGDNVDLRGTLSSTAHKLALATTGTISADHAPLAKIAAALALPAPFAGGKLDVAALRGAATVDATIDIPARKLAALKPNLDGEVSGHITARGPLTLPAIDAKLRWQGYRLATGGIGDTSLVAYGTPASLIAKLEHAGAVSIVANVDRTADRIAIHTYAHANETQLLPLLPAFAAGKLAGQDPGRLYWDMNGTFALVKTKAGFALDQADVTGELALRGGVLKIPHSDRRLHDVGLDVTADAQGIRIKSLAAHETDLEDRDRRIEASGLLAFANMRPKKLTLALAAHDWLLFGNPTLGPADAPHAAADFNIAVDADLTTAIPQIDATVRSLALRSPERFDRGHAPELASVGGDIIYVKSGVRAGRLPIVPPPAPEVPHKRRPLDIHIHIPKSVHLVQQPFDVMAHGELAVTVRDEGVKTRGSLQMERGTLYLFGRTHELVSGSVSFTDEHPHGWMALTFERKLPDAMMRDLASASGGARVSFEGSPTKPKVSLSGAANAALAEVMAMHNAGRAVYVSRPDMPASATVQAPRGDQLSILTYMASNLPHLLFLDKMSAWADPYRSRYGRIENVEAEKYGRGDRSRVRAVMRPQTPGRSSAELQYDRLLIHNDRAAAGVGVRAGDRLGGGIGLFLEWSSKD